MADYLFIVLNENLPFSDAGQFCPRKNLSGAKRKSAGILAYCKIFRDASDDFGRAKPVSPYVIVPKGGYVDPTGKRTVTGDEGRGEIRVRPWLSLWESCHRR